MSSPRKDARWRLLAELTESAGFESPLNLEYSTREDLLGAIDRMLSFVPEAKHVEIAKRSDEEPEKPVLCVHCGRPISNMVHLEGGYRGKQRCDPSDSHMPYGYNAHPTGTPCAYPCLGSVGAI